MTSRHYVDDEPYEPQVSTETYGCTMLFWDWDPLAPAGNGYFGREAWVPFCAMKYQAVGNRGDTERLLAAAGF